MKKDPKQDSESPVKPSQAERIQQLKDRVAGLTGGAMSTPDGSAMDPDLEEEFLENVLAVEEAGWARPADHLTEGGLELTPPDQLDDQELSVKLREAIHAMALRNMYVMSTDHLSERELYVELLEHLSEETLMGPATPTKGFNFIIDLVSSGSDEDTYLYLKYYADDDYRRHWHEDYPEDEMPEKAKPPYDRDRFLPQPDWTPPDSGDDEPLM